MTRKEEIRQAANEYSDKLAVLCEAGNLFKDFCNGAKWADEHPQFVHTDNSQVIANLEAEIERLKNPWRDAKTDPPKEGQCVFVRYGDITHSLHSSAYMLEKNLWSIEGYGNGEVTHWMPIPKLEKGDKL